MRVSGVRGGGNWLPQRSTTSGIGGSLQDAQGKDQSVHLKDCSSFIFAGCTTKNITAYISKLFVFYGCGMHHEKVKAYISQLFVFYLCRMHQDNLKAHMSKLFFSMFAGCTRKSSTHTSQRSFVCYLCRMHQKSSQHTSQNCSGFILSSRDAPRNAQVVHVKLFVFYLRGMHQDKLKAYISKIVRVLSLPDAPRKAHSIHLKVDRDLSGCITTSSRFTSQSCWCSMFAGWATKCSRGTSPSCFCSCSRDAAPKSSKRTSQRFLAFYYVCRMHHDKVTAYISKLFVFYLIFGG